MNHLFAPSAAQNSLRPLSCHVPLSLRRNLKRMVLALSTVLLAGNSAFADTATTTWNGGTTLFTTPGNWNSGLPSATQSAQFSTTFSNQPTVGVSAAAAFQGIYLTTGDGQNVVITGSSPHTLTINGDGTLGGQASAGIMLDDTANHSLEVGSGLTLTIANSTGFYVNNAGTLLVDGTGLALGTSHTLTLGGNNSSGVINLASGISGTTSSIVVNTVGTVILSGTQTFTGGGVTLTAGTLDINNTKALGGATSSTFAINGGTIDNTSGGAIAMGINYPITIGGNFAFTGTNDLGLGSGAVGLGGATRTITANAGTLTFSGIIGTASDGGIIKAGAGTMAINGLNTFTGGLTVKKGTVSSSQAGATGFGNGALNLGNTTGGNSDNATVLYSGASLLVANTITVSAGSSGTLTIEGQTSTNTFTGSIALNNNLTVDNLTAAQTTTFKGAVTENGSAQTITKGSGAGIVTFSTGGVTIGAGGLTLANNGGTLFTVTNGASGVGGSGALVLNANSTGGITVGGTVGVNNSGAITNSGSSNGTTTIAGPIGTNVSSVNENSAGGSALVLNGANTFTGGLNIQNGTVKVGVATAAGAGTVTIGSVGNSGTLDLNAQTETIIGLATAGTAANQTIGNSGSALATLSYTGATTSTFGGIIKDVLPGGTSTTAVTVNNASANLTLSGANTYTGLTTVTAGTLKIGTANAINSGNALTTAAAGTFDLNGNNQTLGVLTNAGTITSSVGTPTLTFGGAAGSTSPGSLTGAMNIIFNNGAVASTLAGSWSNSGNITLNANDVGSITLSTGTVNNTGSITNSGSSSGLTTISAVIGTNVNGGVFQNSTSSVLALSGANTFTSGLTIQKGTLQASGTTALGAGLVTVGSVGNSATLDLNGGSRTIISLASAGTVANQTIGNSSSAAATLNYTGATTSTFGGVIKDVVGGGTGTTAVTVNNASANLTLSGADTYSGLTTVTAGTLNITGDATGTSGGLTISAGGTVNLGSNKGLGTGTLTWNGAIDNTSGSAITSQTVNPAIVLQSGIFSTSAGNATHNLTLGSGAATITASRTVTLNGNNDAVTIGGGLTNTSAAAITLTVNNGASSAGNTLTLAGGYNLSSSNVAPITDVFSGSGAINISGAVANGAGVTGNGLTYSGTGVMTLGGTNTYSGLTTTSGAGGALVISGDETGTSGGLTVSGATAIADINSNKALGTGTLTWNGIIDNTSGSAITSQLVGTQPAIVIGATNNIFGTSGADATHNLNLGTGAVTFNGPRTITLNGTNDALTLGGTMTYTGTGTVTVGGRVAVLTVNGPGDTLVIGGGYNLSSSNATVNNEYQIQGTGNLTINGAVTNGPGGAASNALLYQGSGTLTLAGNNTYSGTTRLLTTAPGTGTLILSGDNSGAGGLIVMSAGTLDVNSNTAINANGITLGVSGSSLGGVNVFDNTSGSPVTETYNPTIVDFGGISGTNGDFAYGGTGDLNMGTGSVNIADSILRIFNLNGSGGHTLTLGAVTGMSGGAPVIEVDGTGSNLAFSSLALNTSGAAHITSIDGTGKLTVNGVVSGGGNAGSGLTYSGTGTLVLKGANVYTGATTVSSGVINFQNGTAFGANSAITVASGGTAQVQGNIAGGGNNLALTIAGTGAGGTTTGALENVSGNNSYTTGSVILSADATISSDAGSLTLPNLSGGGNNVTLTGAGNGTFAGQMLGLASLTKSGTGTWTFSNTGFYSGATGINGGTLAVVSGGTIAAASAVTVNNTGTLNVTGTGLVGGSVLVNSGGTLSGATTGAGSAGAVTVASGNVNLLDGATGTLNTGSLSVTTGNLTFEIGTTAGTIDKITTGTLTIGSGSTSITIDNLNNTISGSQTLLAGSYTLMTYTNGSIPANIGNLTLATTTLDGQTLTLNTTTLGAVILNVGVTATNGQYTLTTTPGSLNVHTGGTTSVATVISNTGTGSQDSVNYSALASSVSSGGTSGSLGSASGTTSGTGLAKGTNNSPGASQTFTATSTAGNVALTNSSTVSNTSGVSGPPVATNTGATINVYSGLSTWQTNGNGSWGTLATGFGANWGTNQGSPGVDPSFVNTDTATFGSALTNATGTVTLDGASPSLKAITFNNSTHSYTIAQGTSGTLKLNGSPATVTDSAGSHTISAPVEFDSSVTSSVTNSGDVLTFSGAISQSGTQTFTVSGAGTTVLSGTVANSYSGLTTISSGELDLNKTANLGANGGGAVIGNISISGGTLKLLANEQIANTADITETSGAFNLNGKTETIHNFSNSGGTFTTGAGKLIGTGASVTWSGGTNTINDGGTVEDKHVSITGGTNEVQGGTTGGVLQVDSGGVGLEMTGASLALDSSTSVAGKLLLQSGVAVTSHASSTTSTISSSGNAANPGVIDLSGGTSTFAVASGTTSSHVDLSIGAKIQNGALNKGGTGTAGAGALELTANNSYGGGTTISNGILYVNNAGGTPYSAPSSQPRTLSPSNSTGSGTGTGSVTVQSGGVLAGSGTIASTSGGVTVQSGGVLASGAAQINAQTSLGGPGVDTVTGTGLTLNNSAALSSALTVNGGATLTFALGAGASTGYLNYANPNTNSTFLSVAGNTAGEISFGTSAAVNVDLIDLTAYQPLGADTLQLRYQNPYLLIQAGANSDYNLFTTGGYDQNGFVTGIGLSNLGSFNLAVLNVNGVDITTSNNYGGLRLYLNNGDLEVVPEPGTWAMMLGGLLMLGLVLRRKQFKDRS